MLPTVVVPLAVAVATVGSATAIARVFAPEAPLDALAIALLLVGPAALVVRRRHPPLAHAVAVAALIAYFGAGYPFAGPLVFLAALIALGTSVTTGHRVPAYAITAVGFTALVLVHVVRDPSDRLFVVAAAWFAWLVALIAAFELWRSRRERLAQARAAREEAERRRGSEERLRIARELHDVLGHHVSLINVQAGVALYLMDDDPEQARTALTAIKQSSRELLREMRATLGVLRGVDEQAPRQPEAGLARLDDLVADTRAAGLPVTVETTGTPRELAPSVDLAAYRIVQEALTNVRKHAGRATAAVRLEYAGDGLTVQVDDDGTGPTGAPGGTGLAGMRERAGALGGTLTAGARPDGGFRVRAHLPAHLPAPEAR